jgi:A/G-specific adenine glycosylase
MTAKDFQKLIWDFYKKNKRNLPWRKNISPYRILVSEVMLQQTQVSRVIPKYALFLQLFPNIKKLSEVPLSEVLAAWQGLGYYRRAKNLKKAAELITTRFHGRVPKTLEELQLLPGVGPNTAGSIAAYAFNLPEVFIETNIRKIYLYHFFKDREGVPDKELIPLIESTLDRKNPRQWYWALMDYGAHLSSGVENPNRRSKHYSIQSKFEGSLRQLRAKVLRLFLNSKVTSKKKLTKDINDKRLEVVLEQLLNEQFIEKQNKKYFIKK